MFSLVGNEVLRFEADCMGILANSGLDVEDVKVTNTQHDFMFHLCIKHITGHCHYISARFLNEMLDKLRLYADPWLQY